MLIMLLMTMIIMVVGAVTRGALTSVVVQITQRIYLPHISDWQRTDSLYLSPLLNF